jgi:flagellar biogenesis protein FliO
VLIQGVMALFLALWPVGAMAHEGPFGLEPILMEQTVGSYVVDVEGNPQLMASQFEVSVWLAGESIGQESSVTLLATWAEDSAVTVRGSTVYLDGHFYTVMPLPQPGDWQMRILIDGPAGQAELTAQVTVPAAAEAEAEAEVTPSPSRLWLILGAALAVLALALAAIWLRRRR